MFYKLCLCVFSVSEKEGRSPNERNALTLTFIKVNPPVSLINIIKTTLSIQ